MKTQLGHYDIVAELGRGGMGVVYKGYESSLNRYVAIKVLAESLAHDESVKERFLREARSMASLNDPHIIQIYFIGEHEGQTFFVMEFVEGESLGSLLKREGKVNPAQAARVIYQTAMGLATAHDKGVVHRDIKPGNLMVTSRGAIKIADFGIALVTQDFSKKLTSTGEFVGTPGYLSPEVCLGKPVDSRSDIFSLGIVLFEMLTGRMPFTDESPLGLMLEVVRAEIPDVRQLNGEVDAELSRILTRMIAKDPNERYNNCHELAEDLSRHPALTGAPTVSLKPMVSTAASTVFGMKTPASAQRPLPQTAPTPRPGGFPNATGTADMPPPPPRQGSGPATRPSRVPAAPAAQAKRSSPLPWAIAAAALLAIAGSVYAFRDQIPFLKSAPQQIAATTTTTATTPAQIASTTPAQTSATPAPVTTASPTSTQPAAPDQPTLGPNTLAQAPATDPSTTTASTLPAQTPATTSSDTPVTNPATSQTVASVEPTGDSGAPEPRASRVDALRELAVARASEDAPPGPRIARANPPANSPVEPSEPRVPTVAVLVGGDGAIAGPARQEVTRALQRAGFNVIDGGRSRDDSGGDIGRLAGRANAAVVVFVRPVGSQVLTYYGQASTLYTAQVSISAFALKGRRSLGAGWTEQVSFTSLNATEKAREVIEPMADDIAQALGEFRGRGGRG